VAQYAPLNAKGNVYAQNGIQAFARGGIVNGPTLFPFAKGIGLMGEAGPEAIMPLRRGRDGNLGVMSSGGGTTNVVVNVDASGSEVEGDAGQAKALGNAISAAVQSELIKQKRPGGLLSA
jgi:lambda family phage tail tape measure protein